MMRTLLLGMLFALTPFAVLGQAFLPTESPADSTFQRPTNLIRYISYSPFEPAALQTYSSLADAPTYLSEEYALDLGAIGDTLSDAQILRRMGRIYEYQSNLLLARARGDHFAVEDMLDISMSALSVLLKQPGMLENEQFQDLYRSVVTQHDHYYGFSDSLTIQRGDIFDIRDHMFSLLNEEGGAPLESITLPELSFADTEIPMTINEKVKKQYGFPSHRPRQAYQ